MGLVEVLKHLPRLLKIRRSIIDQLSDIKPDVFIGIDAPDFNLTVELKLKEKGLRRFITGSPSVWAWRQNRIYKIAKATHQVLAFLPFEKLFMIVLMCLAVLLAIQWRDAIPLKPNRTEACQTLGIDEKGRYPCYFSGESR